MVASPLKRRTLIAAILAIGAVVCFVGTASAVDRPSDPVENRSSIATAAFHQYAGTAPRQGVTIGVRGNGTGVVTVTYRLSLSTANETTAFEQLEANVSANPAKYRRRFGERMDRAVASARAATGRQMAVKRPTVDATREGTTGVITYSFVWTNFATSSNGRLRVDDALRGFYLDDGQRLTIAWPAAYEPTTVRPLPDGRRATSLRWNASTTFGEDEPLVELTPTGRGPPNATASTPPPSPAIGPSSAGTDGSARDRTDTPPPAGSAGEGTNGSGGRIPSSNDGSSIPLAVVAVGVALLVLVAVLHRRRNHGRDRRSPPDGPASTDPDPDGTRETDEPDGSADELLSNEERVVRVLERAGGRAKQQHVVEELGWTDARTSQVVSDLREEGTIESFRLGRENVLSIADDEPTADDSSRE